MQCDTASISFINYYKNSQSPRNQPCFCTPILSLVSFLLGKCGRQHQCDSLIEHFMTGDEMVSDGFKIIDVDDIAYEVDCSVSLALVKGLLLVSHSWLVTV